MADATPRSSLRETFDGLWQDSMFSIASIIVSIVAFVLYGWGAAKLNWSVNQSWFWATLAFIFSGFYYPYYAFVQHQSYVGIFGSARRLRR